MFSKYAQYTPSSYNLFLYLGILLFVSHLYLYGFGIDMSYFGLLLMYIGIAKPVLSNWFFWVLWFFVALDLYANFRVFRDRLFKPVKKGRSKDDDDELDGKW